MKLRNIYVLCKDNVDAIKGLSASTLESNGRQGKRVIEWGKCRSAIECLIKVPALKNECDHLLDTVPSFFITKDTFDISNSEWDKINFKRNMLLRTMEDIIDLCEKMGIETEKRIGLDIKLPQYSDFSEFVSYLNDIEFVFSKCPFLQSDEEKIKFENVDVGSTWLTFAIIGGAVIGGSIVLNNLAAFIDKCIVIRSHYLTTEKQKHDLEVEIQDANEKAIVLKYIESLYKKEVNNAIKEMEKISNYIVKNTDGDEIKRIEQCFDRMGKLIDKGLQIHSSIDSPSEVKVLFEPIEMKYISISEGLKLLEKNETEE